MVTFLFRTGQNAVDACSSLPYNLLLSLKPAQEHPLAAVCLSCFSAPKCEMQMCESPFEK